jgi:prepilin-type N-terminal cleavage/methylation domain-containing protein
VLSKVVEVSIVPDGAVDGNERKTLMSIKEFKSSAFTLVEIMIVVAIIGMLAAIALPNWVRARTASQTTNCINNLRQIDAAKQQWALETKQGTNAPVNLSDISSYMKNTVICPAAGPGASFSTSYNANSVGAKPDCQISPANHVLPLDTTN